MAEVTLGATIRARGLIAEAAMRDRTCDEDMEAVAGSGGIKTVGKPSDSFRYAICRSSTCSFPPPRTMTSAPKRAAMSTTRPWSDTDETVVGHNRDIREVVAR